MIKYPVIVFYSEEDEGFIADIPDLKYCSAFGETIEKAVNELQIAYDSWMECAVKEGFDIPKVSYQPKLEKAG